MYAYLTEFLFYFILLREVFYLCMLFYGVCTRGYVTQISVNRSKTRIWYISGSSWCKYEHDLYQPCAWIMDVSASMRTQPCMNWAWWGPNATESGLDLARCRHKPARMCILIEINKCLLAGVWTYNQINERREANPLCMWLSHTIFTCIIPYINNIIFSILQARTTFTKLIWHTHVSVLF